jgi:hypothetical protein
MTLRDPGQSHDVHRVPIGHLDQSLHVRGNLADLLDELRDLSIMGLNRVPNEVHPFFVAHNFILTRYFFVICGQSTP